MLLRNDQDNTNTKIIATLNDTFRIAACKSVFGEIAPDDVPGKLFVTKGVCHLPTETLKAVFNAIQNFEDFTEDNDPYAQHDFGSVEHDSARYFWKIDYYDKSVTYGSENPADPDQTTRVLTVMLSTEY